MNMIPGKFHGKLASPFMLVHGEKAISILESLSSPSVTSTTTKMALLFALRIRLIRWMVLSSVVPLHPTLFGSTIHATNSTMSLTAIALIRFGCRFRFILQSPTMGVCSAPYIVTPLLPSTNPILQALVLNASIPTPRSSNPAPSWTSPFRRLHLKVNISSNLTTLQLPLSPYLTCPT
jgi:hypothetical protein